MLARFSRRDYKLAEKQRSKLTFGTALDMMGPRHPARRKEAAEMDNVLGDLAPGSLATAIKTNLFDWYRYLGRSAAVECHDDPHLTWLLTGIPTAFLNAVFHMQLPADGGDKIIAEALDLFQARRVKQVFWYADPDGEESDVAKCLVSHGLTFDEGSPGMAIELMGLPDELPQMTGLTIMPVTTAEMLKKWVRTACIGYGLADSSQEIFYSLFANLGFDLPLRSYLALLQGEPVAVSQLFLSAGVGGVYCVATLSHARRRGIGTAVTLAPLLEARKLGYRVGILQSSQAGYPVYRGLGFREYCKLSGYLWTAEGGGAA